MSNRTPGKAAFEAHALAIVSPVRWRHVDDEGKRAWEAIAQAAIDASPAHRFGMDAVAVIKDLTAERDQLRATVARVEACEREVCQLDDEAGAVLRLALRGYL